MMKTRSSTFLPSLLMIAPSPYSLVGKLAFYSVGFNVGLRSSPRHNELGPTAEGRQHQPIPTGYRLGELWAYVCVDSIVAQLVADLKDNDCTTRSWQRYQEGEAGKFS